MNILGGGLTTDVKKGTSTSQPSTPIIQIGELRPGELNYSPNVSQLFSSRNSPNFLVSNYVLLDIASIDSPNINFFLKILELASSA